MGILLSNVSNSPPTVDEVDTLLASFDPANNIPLNASLEVVQKLRADIATSSSIGEKIMGAETPLLITSAITLKGARLTWAVLHGHKRLGGTSPPPSS